VLILYDDREAANHVMRAFHLLSQHCGGDVAFHTDMWKFDTLRSASIARLAADDALNAHVIVVSAHGSDDLPQEVKDWFPSWKGARNGRPGALVAVLDHTSKAFQDMNAAHACLHALAQEGNLEFIPMFVEEEETDLPTHHAASDSEEPPPPLERFCRKVAQFTASPLPEPEAG